MDCSKTIEYKYYVPIIPVALVNGGNGIACGYSTNLPCYNPLDLIRYIRTSLNGEEWTEILIPWYRGFTGSISIIKNGMAWECKCVPIIMKNGSYIVSELPIDLATDAFKTILEKLQYDGSIKFQSYSGENVIKFIITPKTDFDLIGNLRCLTSPNSLKNMLVLDENGIP